MFTKLNLYRLSTTILTTTAAITFYPINIHAEESSSSKSWSSSIKLPNSESNSSKKLFNGTTLDGWNGKIGSHWNVINQTIVGQSFGGKPNGAPRASTYLTTESSHKSFRLLLEAKITGDSSVHTGIAMLGQIHPFKNETNSYQGHLVMIHDAREPEKNTSDWGLFELMRRNWKTGSISGNWCPNGGRASSKELCEMAARQQTDGWHRIEILVMENHIQLGLNGVQILDYMDPNPEILQKGPIGLQLHWLNENDERNQRVAFRGLVIVDNPEVCELLTVNTYATRLAYRARTR